MSGDSDAHYEDPGKPTPTRKTRSILDAATARLSRALKRSKAAKVTIDRKELEKAVLGMHRVAAAERAAWQRKEFLRLALAHVQDMVGSGRPTGEVMDYLIETMAVYRNDLRPTSRR